MQVILILSIREKEHIDNIYTLYNTKNMKKGTIFLMGIILFSNTINAQQSIVGETVMDENIIKMAVKIVKITPEEARTNYRALPEINAFYFSKPIRGGGSVIINYSYECLFAISAVSFEKHVQAFLDGRRTDYNLFLEEDKEENNEIE